MSEDAETLLGRSSHPRLTRQEVIRRLCRLQELAADHVGYDYAADCFCQEGGFWDLESYSERDYRNDGKALEFIEEAVRQRIAEEEAAEPADG